MLDMILQVLSIFGIILLVLLALFLTIIILVLFFPVSYRVSGGKGEAGIRCLVRIRWLLGILRIRYQYPEPGNLSIKVLCFTLYDTSFSRNNSGDEEPAVRDKSKNKKKDKRAKKDKTAKIEKRKKANKLKKNNKKGVQTEREDTFGNVENRREELKQNTQEEQVAYGERAEECTYAENENGGNTPKENKIFLKFKKIKYTICRMYDKMKKIWKNISYYMELLREE